MKIEWDEDKRQRTLRERGLDFADVGLVDWEGAIFIPDTRRDYGERRETMMGILKGRLIVVAFTMREDAVRVISMRKANSRERKVYDSFEA
ncbi:BrnT family toxin [uncultured Sulfitobacter sp.]|uniref:BrnT family toxin n=1 Tax=uncultured Sulfitobacter sp. TaxID=191468 RepID=UPI00261EC9BB|nr:BrnT family toxin [uncultured Sulfitobacter sp.]